MVAIDLPWRRTRFAALLVVVVVGVGLVFGAIYWYLRMLVLAAWTSADQFVRL